MLNNQRMHRHLTPKGLTFWGQWTLASSLVVALLFALVVLKTGQLDYYYRALAAFTILASLPAYMLCDVYSKKDDYGVGLGRLFMGWLLTLIILLAVGIACNAGALFPLEILLLWAATSYALLALCYIPIHSLSRYYHNQLHERHKSLIVGTGKLAADLATTLSRRKRSPLVGLVGARDTAAPQLQSQILGELPDLPQLIRQHGIRRLYITHSLQEATHIEALYINLLDISVDVIWVPDLNNMLLLNHCVAEVDGLPAIFLNESPLTSRPTAALSKSLLDKSLALLAIILLSPLLLLFAVLIKLTSPGSVIFKQDRHGWNGQVIKVWKFRSMRVHDDKEVRQASRNDSRITPVGRFIRRTSIDELPQLFNVLQGHMALVGPRPHAVAHNDYYSGKIHAYMARHRIKPGITGLAQINGCRGETETLEKMQKRVDIDLRYINNWSLWLDIKILLKTPFTLLSKDIY
ncbi:MULTISPECIES: undecaprenyl-phosphate glucose phosphotransferase [unclassified Pseudomonas]|uniref:undecaprenyl-phosphate glucose phosphotransferase n=1 Tax=unclassified Pseudomonas TaxID=196821 RepID=UPI000C880CB3|nr:MULTISPECIES: undecaprenyl-phosphate glucose phosphotransferase [unclassified Pseudomonas]PMX07005.1 undecaprenyl-phosphate glucose phosphotransferase [Pseudomonas sp. MPBC4-3]PMX44337.1 undecaprenyl-phosphate glucose phosphotransferase [Pseudomonas sp. FW301-21B01]PMY03519.1 undecaprenyl-phosphate glucose phosphotransferase [Pseudomonas sp. MPR-R5A]PNA63793.1 undecaprenyl-phosphate glucose phosphotransferase [Pseudomonas sp. MPR-R5B]